MHAETMTMLDGMTARVAMHATRFAGRNHLDDVRQVAYLTALETLPKVDPARPAEPYLAVAALRRCGGYLDHALVPVSAPQRHAVREPLRATRAVGIDPAVAWATGAGPADELDARDLRERVRRSVDAALIELSARDAAICRRLCALDTHGERPDRRDVARETGLSVQRVKQIWARFVRRLRADAAMQALAAD